LANLELHPSAAPGGGMTVLVQGPVEDVAILNNTFYLAKNGIETASRTDITHLDIGGNTFIAEENNPRIGVYINGGEAIRSNDIHVYENTFVGVFGIAVAMEA